MPNKRRMQSRRSLGLCVSCGSPKRRVITPKGYCEKCSKENTKRLTQFKANNVIKTRKELKKELEELKKFLAEKEDNK